MILEPKPPEALLTIQSWMADAVSSLPEEDKHAQCSTFLLPSRHLSADERLDIYIGDFWPRCLESLQEDYPRLYAYFGDDLFESWMERYLTAYPSTHYTLFFLGQNVASFFMHHYDEADRLFVLDLIAVDWAEASLYFLGEEPALNPQQLSSQQQQNFTEVTLFLQPSALLLATSYPILDWEAGSDVPEPAPTYMVMYRDSDFDVQQEPVTYAEYRLLQGFKMGQSLSGMLDIVPVLESEGYDISAECVQQLCATCVEKKWLIHPNS